MTTISLKLPEGLAASLKKAARKRKVTPARMIRECLEKELAPEELPRVIHDARLLGFKPKPGESVYDKALPILRKAWAKNRHLPRDLATNPKYMEGFGE